VPISKDVEIKTENFLMMIAEVLESRNDTQMILLSQKMMSMANHVTRCGASYNDAVAFCVGNMLRIMATTLSDIGQLMTICEVQAEAEEMADNAEAQGRKVGEPGNVVALFDNRGNPVEPKPKVIEKEEENSAPGQSDQE